MDNIFKAKWIVNPNVPDEASSVFYKRFEVSGEVKKATLQLTALGIYEAEINGKRVGDYVLAPGWTVYRERVQYQTYDVTELIDTKNSINISVGQGWRFFGRPEQSVPTLDAKKTALIAALTVEYQDGETDLFVTDASWHSCRGKVRYSNIYNGEIYDSTFTDIYPSHTVEIGHPLQILMPQQGEIIAETQRLPVKELITTPAGETVLDFGQNLTGYVEFKIKGKRGDEAIILHAEILSEGETGNFFTENLRSAKEEIRFICDGEEHIYKPKFSFQGFRYIKLLDWPDEVKTENFTAISVHSDIKRTGYFECSEPLVNKLFENILWGQRDNFLDVPTDCPQRDERLGWTGDAQVFVRTASLNFDVEKFFKKWLTDLDLEQTASGEVPHVIPCMPWDGGASSAWADASVICPWQIYLTYGSPEILARQFNSMNRWVDYIIAHSDGFIWSEGHHFGDWVALDAPNGGCDGLTPKPLIATAYFAYSTSLFIKAGKVLGIDMSHYEQIYSQIIEAFRREFILENGRAKYDTQTSCVLPLFFGLVENKAPLAAQLVELIKECGNHLMTGFLGTPYLLHVLSDNGYPEVAYDLLLRREYPSWLYPVTRGATTMWEHWDSLRPDNTMWSMEMNSFNHYAYGAVGDWLYAAAAGINYDESAPGFKHIVFKPVTDTRLTWVKAAIETRHGTVRSEWQKTDGGYSFVFTVPEGTRATAVLGGKETELAAGVNKFEVKS